ERLPRRAGQREQLVRVSVLVRDVVEERSELGAAELRSGIRDRLEQALELEIGCQDLGRPVEDLQHAGLLPQLPRPARELLALAIARLLRRYALVRRPLPGTQNARRVLQRYGGEQPGLGVRIHQRPAEERTSTARAAPCTRARILASAVERDVDTSSWK